MVVDAVRTGRPAVLTQQDLLPGIRERFERLISALER